MAKIQVANMRYTYIHDGSDKKIDSHHIVISTDRAWIFILHLFLSLFLATGFYHILGNFYAALLCSIIFSAFLVKSLYQKLIMKESVLIFPAFGVQLETHYRSGRVSRRFIPIDEILKPVLNEHVTPFTCYWSLALVVRGKGELILVFKEVKLPAKILIPIWKALCAATCIGEALCAATCIGETIDTEDK